jgi:hypothetical protein
MSYSLTKIKSFMLMYLLYFTFCSPPDDPSSPDCFKLYILYPKNSSNQIMIGDTLNFSVAIDLPLYLDSLKISFGRKDTVCFNLCCIYDTVRISTVPDSIGKFLIKVNPFSSNHVVDSIFDIINVIDPLHVASQNRLIKRMNFATGNMNKVNLGCINNKRYQGYVKDLNVFSDFYARVLRR